MMSVVLDVLIYATAWAHVLLAPFTKVEESFNIHAVHDVLMYGVGRNALPSYDHFTFPGSVPRTFIGSVALGWLAGPFVSIAGVVEAPKSKLDIQILIRLILASLNAWTLCLIHRETRRRFGRTTALFFVLLTCSQFHYPFWMGRAIPNMFATIPVNLAIYTLLFREELHYWTDKYMFRTLYLLTFTAVVFRAEVALLLGPLALQLLYAEKIEGREVLQAGIISGSISLALTMAVDSYFWNRFPLWPEFSSIFFNVIEGKSAEWGTSHPLTYVTSYLPKLLLGALPLAFVGFISDRHIRNVLVAPLSFIALISCLGHKEWRFIIYVVPAFNVAAARTARLIIGLRKGSLIVRPLALIPFALVLVNIPITLLLTQASIANYPGGQALSLFHQLYPATTYPAPHVHISNLAAQTGATLFLQIHSPPYLSGLAPQGEAWVYNKTENLSPAELSAGPFTHLISEVSPTQDATLDAHWNIVRAVPSFDRWDIDWMLVKQTRVTGLLSRWRDVFRMEQSAKLWILERK